MNSSKRILQCLFTLMVCNWSFGFGLWEPKNIFSQEPQWIQPGDRIAWVGGQIFESAQEQGWLEAEVRWRLAKQSTALQDVSFRNVAWSGDDVEGRARAVFGGAEEGYQRRLVDLQAAHPTLAIVSYGISEAMDDRWNPDRFSKGLTRLLQDLQTKSIRVLLLMPPMLSTESPLPGNRVAIINQRIPRYQEQIEQLSKQWQIPTVQLPMILPEWTDDGIHLNDFGNRAWAEAVAKALCPIAPTATARSLDAIQLDIKKIEPWEQNGWQLQPTSREGAWTWIELYRDLGSRPPLRVQFAGLPATGRYQLSVDGEVVATGTAREWNQGIEVHQKGIDRQYLRLRETLVEKDTSFFHRYRPQNETYLFLFRKHEQGNNASEVDRFDGLARELDGRIRSLIVPRSAKWELKAE